MMLIEKYIALDRNSMRVKRLGKVLPEGQNSS